MNNGFAAVASLWREAGKRERWIEERYLEVLRNHQRRAILEFMRESVRLECKSASRIWGVQRTEEVT